MTQGMDFTPASYRAASSDLTVSISPLGLVELADEEFEVSPDAMSMQKMCSKCLQVKSLDDFHKRSRSKDGHMSQCKNCVNERIRKNYALNPAPKIEKTRKYHQDNPDWSRETLAKWHRDNRERRLQGIKDRINSDPEFRDYRREVGARSERSRRAKKTATQFERITSSDYDKILESHGNRCWICESDLDRPVWDHVHPIAKGGAHVVSNLRPACGPCNVRKSAKWPFTNEDKNRIANEVSLLRAHQGNFPVTDGQEV